MEENKTTLKEQCIEDQENMMRPSKDLNSYGFIMGGAEGVDRFAQEYIFETYPSVYICVYDKGNQCNIYYENVDHINGFNSYTDREITKTITQIFRNMTFSSTSQFSYLASETIIKI